MNNIIKLPLKNTEIEHVQAINDIALDALIQLRKLEDLDINKVQKTLNALSALGCDANTPAVELVRLKTEIIKVHWQLDAILDYLEGAA